jgi:glycerol-3-phosphate acyltransferase PlsY
LLDAAKGFFAPCLALWVLDWSSPWAAPMCGVMAVVGHCYTPWLRLRGGKGVATCLGVMLCLNPLLGTIGAAIYGAALALSRVSAIGSLAGCGAATLFAWVAPPGGPHLANASALSLCFCLILWRHRSNLRSLLNNSESERP